MINGSLIMMTDMLGALDVANIATAGGVLLVVGLFFIVILTIANAKLKVEVDPTVEAILNVLPGANCGGCGLAGCGSYAEAVVKDHGLMGKCGPGGESLVHEIAGILGIEATTSAPQRAIVHCVAKSGDKINSTRYQGIITCTEANIVAGAMGCAYGCLGFRDCAEVCDFDAIEVVDGLTTINYEKCVGCGACVKACPRQLIELLPFKEGSMLVISCSSRDKAKEVWGYCKVGCVGCGVCAKQGPGAFSMKDNLAVIDYENYGLWADYKEAVQKCPRALMVFVGRGEAPFDAAERPAKAKKETPAN